jgi:hypothetical protein
MGMNESIMAGAGAPPPSGGVVRVPIQGPFNTLVIVHCGGATIIPGIRWNNCDLVRYDLSFPSKFILAGFDQRSPPDFRHSTTGFLSYIGSGDDASFVYAIDQVSASFDETGRYWVNYKSACLNDCEVTAGYTSLSSWVLVNEPLQDKHAARLPWAVAGQILQLGGHGLNAAVSASGLRKLTRSCDCDGAE